ncbi:MAG: hypothetical protein MMC33_008444, partial [Icmadophila ericetorum]|nr:hypothetical protein [Icmadophila ericetorum]
SVTEWQHHIAATAAATGLSGQNGLFEAAARTYRARSPPAGNRHDGPEPSAAQRAQHAGEFGQEPGPAPTASAAMGAALQQGASGQAIELFKPDRLLQVEAVIKPPDLLPLLQRGLKCSD